MAVTSYNVHRRYPPMPSFLPDDLPVRHAAADYTRAVEDMVARLSAIPDIVSVYGIGGVGAPGISDLDMVAVVRDGATLEMDPRAGLSVSGRYLFIHTLYGACVSQFKSAQSYSFFHPYRLLYGEDLLSTESLPEPLPVVRTQVAMEYLLKFHISVVMQRVYRMVRVRSLLLNGKGAAIDIRHLDPDNHEANALIEELMQLRSSWFSTEKPPVNALIDWFCRLQPWFDTFLYTQLQHHAFYVPEYRPMRMSRHVELRPSAVWKHRHQGIRLPFLHRWFGRDYFKLLNRLNRITFDIPFRQDGIPQPVLDYFSFNAEHRNYNRIHLPRFLPLTSSLHVR